MRAVDTNILARFYLRDDTAQGRIAADVLTAGDVFIPKTVVLELEWVLRYVADQPPPHVWPLKPAMTLPASSRMLPAKSFPSKYPVACELNS